MSKRLKKFLSVADMDVDFGQRIIQGYFSKFTPDPIGDLTRKGTFLKTIKERGPRETTHGIRSKIKMGFNHGEVIGIPVLIKEDDTGAYFEGKVDEHDLGDRILTRVKSGSLDACSFEYSIINAQPIEGDKSVRRILTEVKLYELGPVDYPMHEDAIIYGMKSQEGIGEASQRVLELLQIKTDDFSSVSQLKSLFNELKDLFGEPTAEAVTEAVTEPLIELVTEAPPEAKRQPILEKILEELTKFNLSIKSGEL